jgi:hypothetical protein
VVVVVVVVKLGTPQDRRLDRSDERQKGDCESERTKGEGEMSTLTLSEVGGSLLRCGMLNRKNCEDQR